MPVFFGSGNIITKAKTVRMSSFIFTEASEIDITYENHFKEYAIKDIWIDQKYNPGIGGTEFQQLRLISELQERYKQNDINTIEVKRPETKYSDGPPCIELMSENKIGEGGRNNALFHYGVYAKSKWPENWKTKIMLFNESAMEQPLSDTEVNIITKQHEKKDWGYKCNDQPIAGHCNSPLCRTRKYGIGASGGTPLFSNLTKQNSDPPIWFLDVEGGRLELETEELLNQTKFQRKCMDSLNIIPPKVRDNVWRTIIQQLLDNLTIIEVPQDASTEGHFNELLETFCTERPARERDELLLGKPWSDKTRTYFRLADLMDFLHRKNFRDYPRNKLTAKLKNMGGEAHFFNIKGKGVNVWHIPEFQVQTESHTLPEFNDSPL